MRKSGEKNLANLIIYREERKLKKKELSKKIIEEIRRKLEQMIIQGERARAECKCRVLKNPDKIEYEKNGRKEGRCF